MVVSRPRMEKRRRIEEITDEEGLLSVSHEKVLTGEHADETPEERHAHAVLYSLLFKQGKIGVLSEMRSGRLPGKKEIEELKRHLATNKELRDAYEALKRKRKE